MTLLRTTVAAVLTTLAVLTLSASPALAHAGLTGSTPTDGATLDAVPTEVELEFSEEVRAPAFAVITGPDGRSHEAGQPTLDGATLTQQVEATRSEGADPNGTWTIAYRVVSADGHPIQGQTTFTVEGAAAPDEQPSAGQPTESPSTPGGESPSADPAAPSADDADAVSDTGPSSVVPLVIAGLAAFLCVGIAIQQTRKRQNKGKAKETTQQ